MTILGNTTPAAQDNFNDDTGGSRGDRSSYSGVGKTPNNVGRLVDGRFNLVVGRWCRDPNRDWAEVFGGPLTGGKSFFFVMYKLTKKNGSPLGRSPVNTARRKYTSCSIVIRTQNQKGDFSASFRSLAA